MGTPMRALKAGSFGIIPFEIFKTDLSPSAIRVYTVLISFQGNNDICWPSRKTIARRANLCQESVTKATNELKTAGWLSVKRRGQSLTNVYQPLFPASIHKPGSFGLIPFEIFRTELSPAAIRVFAVIYAFQGANEYAWPSQKQIAVRARISEDCVSRVVGELSSVGWLKKIRRGLGKTNVYQTVFPFLESAEKHENTGDGELFGEGGNGVLAPDPAESPHQEEMNTERATDPTGDHVLSYEENNYNHLNDTNIRQTSKKSLSEILVEPIRLARLLLTLHQKIDAKFKVSEKQLESWAIDIERLMRLDGRGGEEIEKALRWAKKPDCFWASNILSGAKLRKQFPLIWSQMNQDRGGNFGRSRTRRKFTADDFDFE